jgi:hypothetical protein
MPTVGAIPVAILKGYSRIRLLARNRLWYLHKPLIHAAVEVGVEALEVKGQSSRLSVEREKRGRPL